MMKEIAAKQREKLNVVKLDHGLYCRRTTVTKKKVTEKHGSRKINKRQGASKNVLKLRID